MEHGGDLTAARARHGGEASAWLDLSTGINPHPWPIPDRLRLGDWTRLPAQADMDAALAAARQAYGVPAGVGIVAAAGTQALIQWLPQLAPPESVGILGPTYAEHALSWRRAGVEVREIGHPDGIGEARHVVVVNPNNPDGRLLPQADLMAIAARCEARQGWLVLDESFADTMPEASLAGRIGKLPVVVLRSFGKFYGLAGLRLGFAIARPDLAGLIAGALGPWAVSAPALAIGTEALLDRGWAVSLRVRLAQEAEALDAVLRGAGLEVVGGTSLYRLARHNRARDIHDRLAAQHVWVRRFDWADDLLRFGLPPDQAARERLAVALARAVSL